MPAEAMIRLVERLVDAKSRQNVGAALEVLHDDMLLETPAIGSVVRGRSENREALTRFFTSFPDYSVALEKHIVHGSTMICWGTARMTMTGSRFGSEPSGRRAELPVMIEFEFRDGAISRERFHYDLSSLCAQSGISTDVARRALFGAAWETPSIRTEGPIPSGYERQARRSPVTDPWEPLFVRQIGAELRIAVRLRDAHCNSRGFAHGGLVAALADNAMGHSALNAVRARDGLARTSAVTVSLSLDYLDSGRIGELLEVHPTVLRAGTTLSFVESKVLCDTRTIARANATFRMV
jgi:acyl-coenzyme A thioesterase PaaI-like protein/predicted ester cyclase